jgi:phosphoglycolate phosphatase
VIPQAGDTCALTRVVPPRAAASHMPMPLPNSLPVIVFDLDGTLADTAHDIIATLNFILAREGLEPIPLALARDLIGQGSRALLLRGFALQGREIAPEKLDRLFAEFLAHYAEHLVDETRLFPGVEAALERLSGIGHRLAVCTNKHEAPSRDLLTKLGVAPLFAAICGRDTFPFCKPDPRHLTQTVRLSGGDGRAIMVGDSKTDIDTARAAGLPVIAVPFGYSDTPVAELSPDIMITHFDEIDVAIGELSKRFLAAGEIANPSRPDRSTP